MAGKTGTSEAGPGPLLITVVALVLWAVALVVISRTPLPEKGILVYRVDVNEVVAYPRSDAAMEYLNGMALASGDGWVGWREAGRWSIYRPGWGAFVGALILLTGGDPAAIQSIVTFLLAATAPAFMLLVLWLYRGWGGLVVGTVAAVLWLLHPFFGWTLHRTLMSEGPAMLLALLFCALAIRFAGRQGEWSWRQGLLLGLVGGALSMVREQGRYGVLAVILLLLVSGVGRGPHRLPFFASLLAGLLVVVGPLYLKTSIHLRMPYLGTPLVALYNVLEFTPVGRAAGGPGMAIALSRLRETTRAAFLEGSRYVHGVSGAVARLRVPPLKRDKPMAGKIAVLHALTALGLFIGWRRAGPVVLAPLLFAAGYLLPMALFHFYSNRLGVPISWVGLVYLAGLPLVFRLWRGSAGPAESVDPAPDPLASATGWPARSLGLLVGGWLVLATSLLLWMDHRPLAEVDVERLLADERSRRTLTDAGVEATPDLVEEAERVLDEAGESSHLLAGIAVLPMTVAPGDAPVMQPFSKERLPAGEEPYGLFHLVSPWKSGGTLRISRVRLPGAELAGVEPGDQVLVVRSPDSVETVGRNGIVTLDAAAILPTRWTR